MNTPFAVNLAALICATVFCGLFLALKIWGKSYPTPQLFFSNKAPLEEKKIAHFASLGRGVALILFLLAFIDPKFMVEQGPTQSSLSISTVPTEGLAVYLVLDRSGSMAQEIVVTTELKREKLTKLAFLKDVTKNFVAGRPSDLIGLVAFSRSAQVLAPLTLDHQSVLENLDALKPATSVEEDGTSIGYAIYKTASLIAATRHYAEALEKSGETAYTIGNALMVVVTDGVQEPNPLDQDSRLRNISLVEAATYAKQQDIRVYIVSVEPRIATEEYRTYKNAMEEIATLTGGRLFLVSRPEDLQQVYRAIDELEKSPLPPPIQKERVRGLSFYPYFIGAALLFLALSILIETVWRREVP